jgi:hypothetical protein
MIPRDRGRPQGARRSAALAAWAAMAAPAAHAASSASYKIANGGVVDAAGGTSSSASFQVSACVGSEIAGAQASLRFRVESGCGPGVLAIAKDFPVAQQPQQIPVLSGPALALLIGALAAVALKRLHAARH